MIKPLAASLLLFGVTVANAQTLEVVDATVMDDAVAIEVRTDMATPFEVMGAIELANQAPDDRYVGHSEKFTITQPSQTLVVPRGYPNEPLPSGDYEARVTFYPLWGGKNSPASTKAIDREIDSAVPVRLEGAFAVGELSPQDRPHIEASVELFDALERCRASGDFAFYGYGAGGSCGSWMSKFERVRNSVDGQAILRAGFQCFPAEAYMYGTTFYRSNPDLQHRAAIKGYFDECRAALR